MGNNRPVLIKVPWVWHWAGVRSVLNTIPQYSMFYLVIYSLSHRSREFLNKTSSSCSSKYYIISKYEIKVSQPVLSTKRSKQIKIRYTCKNENLTSQTYSKVFIYFIRWSSFLLKCQCKFSSNTEQLMWGDWTLDQKHWHWIVLICKQSSKFT